MSKPREKWPKTVTEAVNRLLSIIPEEGIVSRVSMVSKEDRGIQ